MIVCICRRLNDKQVGDAIQQGAACPNAIMKHHGQRFNCGQCREEMHEMLVQNNDAQIAGSSIAAE
ncbi:MAG: (2Fe-2S)-binding protein [Hirschia sp.]|nr:(2Fe-2S)-binding protein [Hirschia sp.]MBF19495.1 (2Fe-2S)-binding protein [Hirschia sp.]|tara:strand:+ start:59 stop:256 length:198 start_codon:yes stop_codon:yes gene_type:complete